MRGARRKYLGNLGEDLAVDFLKDQGYGIIERNCRKKYGEIDILAKDLSCLVFVEVRTRTTSRFGGPISSVGHLKQKRLAKVALSILQKKEFRGMPARFDVLGIELPREAPPRFHLVKNAFEPDVR